MDESSASVMESTIFCPECNTELKPDSEICTNCGLILPSAKLQSFSTPSTISSFEHPISSHASGRKSLIAVILTLLFLPAGYWYVKRIKRGILVFLMSLIALSLEWTMAAFIVFCIAIYDVYRLAKNESAPLDFLNRWGL